MIYNEKIYYKKINDYSEYKVVKNRWEEIIDMQEEDFKNNFMIITAIENTSMQGLIVDKIEVDNDTLYISLIREDAENIEFEKYKSGRGDFSEEQIKEFKELDKKYEKSCICYLIPRTMERENIVVTRNLRDDEKIFSESFWEVKTENFTITKEMPDINFSSWENLGNDFYALRITNCSEYKKFVNNYNITDVKWIDFEDIFGIIVIRANDENSIGIDKKDDKIYEVKLTDRIENNSNIKYSGIVIKAPNYMNLKENYLKIVKK